MLPDWFTEHLFNLQEASFLNTGSNNMFALTVSAEFGLKIGIAPGDTLHVAGPVGYIHITAEKS